MKKDKITIYFTICLISMILVCVIMMRFKSIEQSDLKTRENLAETELRTEISNYKEKYNESLEELESINSKIQEYKEKIDKNEYDSDLILKELKDTNNLLGKTNVKGDGVLITLTDNEFEKIIESDISELINELKYAGAEAISVNNIRLDVLSDVSSTKENAIILNGQKISSPYIIKAIGNQNYLYSTLTAKNGFIDYYTKKYKLSITIEKQKNMEIEKSITEYDLKYVKSE